MEIIAREDWAWTLYRDGDLHYLSVVCGSIGIYEVVVELDLEERKRFGEWGLHFIRKLAVEVRNDPGANAERFISGFTQRAEVISAQREERTRV